MMFHWVDIERWLNAHTPICTIPVPRASGRRGVKIQAKNQFANVVSHVYFFPDARKQNSLTLATHVAMHVATARPIDDCFPALILPKSSKSGNVLNP